MSTHVVNIGTEDQDDILPRFIGVVMSFLGPATVDLNVGTGDVTLTFAATLTAQQVNALTEFARSAKTGLSRAERNGIEADIQGLITYQGIATPTLAQTVQAVKAQSRILRAILRS